MSLSGGSPMIPNPYQPPGSSVTVTDPPGGNRTWFVLAAVGAGLASVFWAALAVLLGLGMASGGVSGTRIILPGILVVLYAARGYQIFKGDPAAARRILWLHGFGGIMAAFQMLSGSGLVSVLQGVKLAIHVFGAITAYLAQRPRSGP